MHKSLLPRKESIAGRSASNRRRRRVAASPCQAAAAASPRQGWQLSSRHWAAAAVSPRMESARTAVHGHTELVQWESQPAADRLQPSFFPRPALIENDFLPLWRCLLPLGDLRSREEPPQQAGCVGHRTNCLDIDADRPSTDQSILGQIARMRYIELHAANVPRRAKLRLGG